MNTLMKTNYFSANVSNMIFQYKMADLGGQVLPINERFREARAKRDQQALPRNLTQQAARPRALPLLHSEDVQPDELQNLHGNTELRHRD